LKGAGFLAYWDKFPARNEDCIIFERRIVTGVLYSREWLFDDNGAKFHLPFHPSDLWFLGLTSDLQKYFLDTNLMTDQELALWPFKYPERIPAYWATHRYAPEQYYLVAYLKRCPGMHLAFDDSSDWNMENVSLSQKILYNNFVFLGLYQSGVHNFKHAWLLEHDIELPGLITYDLFQLRYKEYCDPGFSPHTTDSHRLKLLELICKIQSKTGERLFCTGGGSVFYMPCIEFFWGFRTAVRFLLFKRR
jgi:hypothetical protein